MFSKKKEREREKRQNQEDFTTTWSEIVTGISCCEAQLASEDD